MPFSSQGYFQAWQRHLAAKFNVSYVVGPYAIGKERLSKTPFHLKVMRPIGWNTGWASAIHSTELMDTVFLETLPSWDIARLIPGDPVALASLCEALTAKKIRYGCLPAEPELQIDLTSGWESYVSQLKRKQRSELNRKQRHLEQTSHRVMRYESSQEITSFFEGLFRAHQAYWQDKPGGSFFADPREQSCFLEWALSLQGSGQLILMGLEVKGEMVNYKMNLRRDQDEFGLLTVNTAAFPELSPGLQTQFIVLQAAAEAGVTRFHLGPGDYRYKQLWATDTIERQELIIANPKSRLGELFQQALCFKHRLCP